MFTVALLQMTSHGHDQAANLAKGEEYCRRAAAMGADLALFPEIWNIGYTYHRPAKEEIPGVAPDPMEDDLWRSPEYWPEGAVSRVGLEDEAIERYHAQAIERDSPFVTHFRNLARELRMAIAITYLERWDPLPRNTVSVIDRHGDMVLTYAKVHTCDFDLPEAALTPGDGFHVGTLDTAGGEVEIGAMICYDREFPESARVLMLKGAEIVLVPNSCMLHPINLEQFRMRAYENMIGVAMTNYAGSDPNGHSVAYDPIAFVDGKPRDTLVLCAGEDEGIYLAPFDLERLREYRRRESSGNAFRKPHCYELLSSELVRDPFVRLNPSGEAYHEKARRR